MSRSLPSAVILSGLLGTLLGAASMPLAARAATPLQLKSVKIDLPDSDRMFTGPGADGSTTTVLPVIQPVWC
jgi:hypothetical protein